MPVATRRSPLSGLGGTAEVFGLVMGTMPWGTSGAARHTVAGQHQVTTGGRPVKQIPPPPRSTRHPEPIPSPGQNRYSRKPWRVDEEVAGPEIHQPPATWERADGQTREATGCSAGSGQPASGGL